MIYIIGSIFHISKQLEYMIFGLLLRLCGVKVGHNVQVSSSIRIECPSKVNIGDETYIGSRVYLGAYNGIEIKSDVMIGSGTALLSADHNFENKTVLVRKQGLKKEQKGIVIENNVWIGMNCIILKCVTIGHGSIIGAGSVVTKSCNPFSVMVGNPAREIYTR